MLRKLAIILAVSAMVQGLAAAGTYTSYTDIGTVLTGAGVSYKPSNNVEVYYINDGVASPQAYTIGSKNTAGDYVYATSNLAGNIYRYIDTSKTPAGTALKDLTTLLPANAGESTGWDKSTWEPI